jgi:hypothetical protein
MALAVVTLAQSTDPAAFADHLSDMGEYYRAVTEYHRLAFQAGDDAERRYYLYRIAELYFRGRDYEGLKAFYSIARQQFAGDTVLQEKVKIMVARGALRSGLPADAVAVLEPRTRADLRDSLADGSRSILGLSYATLGDWDRARACFTSIAPGGRYSGFRDLMLTMKDGAALGPAKSPLLAGILSAVVPGAGYVYAGRIGTGVTSFLVNGLLIWSIRDALHDSQYGIALTLGFFGLGWFVGNITGSADAAEEYNSAIRSKLLEYLPSD